jgi:hypothetical protein
VRAIVPLLAALTLSNDRPPVAGLSAPQWGAITPVRCGNALGTAFHIGGGRYITASHVASWGACAFDGIPAATVLNDKSHDVAELAGPTITASLKVNCAGFRRNRHYLAVGFVSLIGRLSLPLIYSGFGRDPDNGHGMFVGPDAHPGMSGGPLLDEDYRVSGVVVQRWPSRARALADTHVCREA